MRTGAKRKIRKELNKRTVRKIREQGGMSCKLFWSDLRGKRKERRLNRLKDEEGRVVEGEDEVVEVLARHWEELGWSNKNCIDDDIVPDRAMGDMGGCETPGPDGSYVWWWKVVEVMLQVMNLVLRSEFCAADWRKNLVMPLLWMVTMRK